MDPSRVRTRPGPLFIRVLITRSRAPQHPYPPLSCVFGRIRGNPSGFPHSSSPPLRSLKALQGGKGRHTTLRPHRADLPLPCARHRRSPPAPSLRPTPATASQVRRSPPPSSPPPSPPPSSPPHPLSVTSPGGRQAAHGPPAASSRLSCAHRRPDRWPTRPLSSPLPSEGAPECRQGTNGPCDTSSPLWVIGKPTGGRLPPVTPVPSSLSLWQGLAPCRLEISGRQGQCPCRFLFPGRQGLAPAAPGVLARRGNAPAAFPSRLAGAMPLSPFCFAGLAGARPLPPLGFGEGRGYPPAAP